MSNGQTNAPQTIPLILWVKNNIRPLPNEADPELAAYQEVSAPYAQQLAGVISRSRVNNAFLQGDDPALKRSILMQLKQQVGEGKSFFSLDCAPKMGNFLPAGWLSRILERPASVLGLPEDNNTPTVMVLENPNSKEATQLTQPETLQRIKKQNPHFQFIITGSSNAEPQSNEEMLAEILIGKEASSTPSSLFETVRVSPLKANQWVPIIQQDNEARKILQHSKKRISNETLQAFLQTLQQHTQSPLNRDQILNELDKMASHFQAVSAQDITTPQVRQYAKDVLALEAKKARHSAQNPMMAMMPKPYTIINSNEINTRLEDVVGHEDAKSVLQQALDSVKYPALFAHLDEGDEDAPNNNVLLLGEPGGGKTMLAKAIAGQGGGTFISSSGSQFVNMIVGMGANNMRRLKEAIEDAPDDLVVVFIDEIDSLGSRDGVMNYGEKDLNGLAANREETQTINEFLAITEGVSQSNKKVLLIGATNRPQALDDGILSRFHYKMEIKKLNAPQRKELLSKQLAQKNLTPDDSVDLEKMARQTEGLSGRDIRNLMKLAKQELVKRIPVAEKERLEHDAEARSRFRLHLSQEVLEQALRQVKEGWENAKQQEGKKPVPLGMYG